MLLMKFIRTSHLLFRIFLQVDSKSLLFLKGNSSYFLTVPNSILISVFSTSTYRIEFYIKIFSTKLSLLGCQVLNAEYKSTALGN